MKLLTKAIEEKLIKNFRENEESGDKSFKPVVKFFGGSSCTWLITEYDPENRLFFGLADLGMGCPEMGWISRDELESLRFPPFRLPIERDRHTTFEKTLREYAEEARAKGRIEA